MTTELSLTIQRNLKASFKSTETRDWLRYGMHILSVAQSLGSAGSRDSVLQTERTMAAGHRPAGAPTRYPGKRTGSESLLSLQEQKKLKAF